MTVPQESNGSAKHEYHKYHLYGRVPPIRPLEDKYPVDPPQESKGFCESFRSTLRAHYYNGRRIARLAAEQIRDWKPARITELRGSSLAKISCETLKSLSESQAQGLRWRQVRRWSPQQIEASCAKMRPALVYEALYHNCPSLESKRKIIKALPEDNKKALVDIFKHLAKGYYIHPKPMVNKSYMDLFTALALDVKGLDKKIREIIKIDCTLPFDDILTPKEHGRILGLLYYCYALPRARWLASQPGQWEQVRPHVPKGRIGDLDAEVARYRKEVELQDFTHLSSHDLREWPRSKIEGASTEQLDALPCWSVCHAWKGKRFQAALAKMSPGRIEHLTRKFCKEYRRKTTRVFSREETDQADHLAFLTSLPSEKLQAIHMKFLLHVLVQAPTVDLQNWEAREKAVQVLTPLFICKQLQGLLRVVPFLSPMARSICENLSQEQRQTILEVQTLDQEAARKSLNALPRDYHSCTGLEKVRFHCLSFLPRLEAFKWCLEHLEHPGRSGTSVCKDWQWEDHFYLGGILGNGWEQSDLQALREFVAELPVDSLENLALPHRHKRDLWPLIWSWISPEQVKALCGHDSLDLSTAQAILMNQNSEAAMALVLYGYLGTLSPQEGMKLANLLDRKNKKYQFETILQVFYAYLPSSWLADPQIGPALDAMAKPPDCGLKPALLYP